ncbi:MAG: glycogen synthase GlgA [Tissierellia bacterium]|nr:glycogen synthase GlgA [Tissierellia bacterium]
MKILYVTSEAVPFIKTGGLADVAGSLPKAISDQGHDIRVVLPLYSSIGEKYRSGMKKVHEFYVDLGWLHKYCGVFQYDLDGVTFYFLDNEEYFNRDSLYGHFDDAERFIFFSKASVLITKELNFQPDVIHSNDWHSGLVSAYVNDFRTGDDFFENTKTLYTIHNLKYQGLFDPKAFAMTGLAERFMSSNDLEFNNALSFMKGGIVHSTKFNTVSKTYAQEIKYPFFGEGLQDVINYYSDKLSGIVNGIDYDTWNPKTDEFLVKNYDGRNFKTKVENKRELQKLYGLPQRDDVCMIGMVTRLTSMKGLEILRYILEELLQEDIQFVMLGTGDYEYEEMFKYFEYKYPEKVAARIYFSNEESHLIYGGSDLFMMPSVAEPCGISQLIAMRYGSLPIVRETGGLKDTVIPYNQYTNEGTGFTFENINAHELLFKTKEAVHLYYDNSEAFTHLIKNALKHRNDWKKSSQEYINLYRSL